MSLLITYCNMHRWKSAPTSLPQNYVLPPWKASREHYRRDNNPHGGYISSSSSTSTGVCFTPQHTSPAFSLRTRWKRTASSSPAANLLYSLLGLSWPSNIHTSSGQKYHRLPVAHCANHGNTSSGVSIYTCSFDCSRWSEDKRCLLAYPRYMAYTDSSDMSI